MVNKMVHLVLVNNSYLPLFRMYSDAVWIHKARSNNNFKCRGRAKRSHHYPVINRISPVDIIRRPINSQPLGHTRGPGIKGLSFGGTIKAKSLVGRMNDNTVYINVKNSKPHLIKGETCLFIKR